MTFAGNRVSQAVSNTCICTGWFGTNLSSVCVLAYTAFLFCSCHMCSL